MRNLDAGIQDRNAYSRAVAIPDGRGGLLWADPVGVSWRFDLSGHDVSE
jgi:hypothetical protein